MRGVQPVYLVGWERERDVEGRSILWQRSGMGEGA